MTENNNTKEIYVRRCELCEWWEERGAVTTNRGQCRRHPPTAVNDFNNMGRIPDVGHWPLTRYYDYCGAFSIDEERV